MDCGEALFQFLAENTTLEIFMADWNNLRGVPGEKVIDGLSKCYMIKKISLSNNLLGVAYDD